MPDPLKKTVRMVYAPFEFTWPDRRVSVVRQTGVFELPVQIADAALAAGMAEPVDMPKPARPRRSTSRKPAPKLLGDDETTLAGADAGMDGADLAGADLPDGGLPGEAASER